MKLLPGIVPVYEAMPKRGPVHLPDVGEGAGEAHGLGFPGMLELRIYQRHECSYLTLSVR